MNLNNEKYHYQRMANPALYEEIRGSFEEDYQRKIVQEIVQGLGANCKIAERYLLGEVEVKELYPFVKEWREKASISSHDILEKSILLRKTGNQQMYERTSVLMALIVNASFFVSDWMEEENKEEINEIIQIFSRQKVSRRYQLELLASIYEYYGDDREEKKEAFLNNCIQVLAVNKREWEHDIVLAAKNGNIEVREFGIKVLDFHWQEYKGHLIDCVEDMAKQIQTLLVTIYESHKEWEADIKELLDSKKLQEREVAVQVLARWGIDNYREELLRTIKKEKSKKVRDLIQNYLGISEEEGRPAEKTKEEMIARILKRSKKKSILWVYEPPLPIVHMLDGSEASKDYMRAILLDYTAMKTLGVSADAIKLAKELEPKELAEYMEQLFDRWMKLGAEEEKKWVLYAASIHGGETIVPVLYAQIQEWSRCERSAIAEEAVKVLALNGSMTAFFCVDQISKECKYPQIKAAATESFEDAARQLGITKEELEDRIVPNFGFNERMERTFDYVERKLIVTLTPTLEFLIVGKNGRKLKSFPKPGKLDDEEKANVAYEEYKLLEKQLKMVVTNQKMRLQQAWSTKRLWKATQWREVFLKNPVMHQIATGLLWGCYEDGQLKESFNYMEDGSFRTIDKKEYKFPEEGMIGLADLMGL